MVQKTLENLKIASLNEMQLATLDALKKGGDIVLLSPTGSGKTLGFLLPVLKMIDPNQTGVQALILVPSRELALQIEQVFRSMGTGFKVNCCYGGHSTKTEKNNFSHAPSVLIGTPGRLAYHVNRHSFDTTTVHTLVMDEFDKALEFGFQEDMSFIISELTNVRKRILTSATQAIEIPAFTGITSPIEINFLSDEQPKGLKLKAVVSESADKLDALFALMCKLGDKPTLVFCNHREAVERISYTLHTKGLVHDIFHGGMEQEDRELALIKFRNGSHKLLITTDLASRGLDIPEIEFIVHYHLPTTENAFVHRNGRTARMNAEGTSYLIITENEKLPAYLKEAPEMEALPTKLVLPKTAEWSTLYIAGGKKDKINKTDIVGLLLQKGKLAKEELGLIEVQDYSSYAAVKSEKINGLVQLLKKEPIKKKVRKIEIAR